MNISPIKHISDDKYLDTFPSISTNFGEIRQEELVTLMDVLKRQGQSLTTSPRKVILDHTIQICQSTLNNLLKIDWHKHLYEQVKLQDKGLNDQLKLMLKLLSSTHLPDQNHTADTDKKNDEQQIIYQARECIDNWLQMSSPEELNDDVTEKHLFQNIIDNCSQVSLTEPTELTQSLCSDYSGRLDVHFLGVFRVHRDGELIDCLSKSRAKQLLKYLILNRTKLIPKELLMDRFWPNYDQNSARNNLNVAVYCLRQTLKSEHSNYAHVLFQDNYYFLNPNLQITVDTEVFECHVKKAEHLEAQHKMLEAIEEYKCAEAIYEGEFLAEDIYEDWSLRLREHYKLMYVKVLGKLSDFYYQQSALEACIAVNRKITLVEIADEQAHRRLMECFVRLDQRHFAMRQYHICRAALAKELELKPSKETVALYETIKTQYADKAG